MLKSLSALIQLSLNRRSMDSLDSIPDATPKLACQWVPFAIEKRSTGPQKVADALAA